DASAIYNRFVYDKGASVLLMLESWIGEEKFRDGLRGYLTAHRFSTASTDDLSDALRAASGKDIAPVMHAFMDVGGAPIVHGETDCSKTGAASPPAQIRIYQTGSGAVPACWRTNTGESGCEVIDSYTHSVKLAACPAWVYWNAGGTGYYRSTWTP